ncbi:restriction endonuclease subunit S [Flavobacteriaceae bacterium M23B6Z8]
MHSDRIFNINLNSITRRLDPNPYQPKRLEAIKAIKESPNNFEELLHKVEFKKRIVKSFEEELPYLGLQNIESNTGKYINKDDIKVSFSSAFKFKKGEILFPKLRPYLNKIHLCEFDGYCSTEFHVLKAQDVNNVYLSAFLRSSIVVSQTSCLMTGNTLPRLQTKDVTELIIPLPDMDVQKEIADKVIDNFKQSNALKVEAETEFQKAKQQVEQIILGK